VVGYRRNSVSKSDALAFYFGEVHTISEVSATHTISEVSVIRTISEIHIIDAVGDVQVIHSYAKVVDVHMISFIQKRKRAHSLILVQ